MRKFLCEYESIYTIEDLKNGDEFKEFVKDYPGATFEEYLDLCMFWNNGFLTEILTNETPIWERRRSVSLCLIYNPDFPNFDDGDVQWLDYYEILRKQSYGYIVMPYHMADRKKYYGG